MDSALSTFGFVIFGFTFSIYAFLVESRSPNAPSAILTSHSLPPPPTSQPSPPRRSPLPPSPASTPPPSHSPSHRHGASEPQRPKAKKPPPKHRPPPPPPAHQMNVRKMIGLLFAGIAGIMQIGVVGFLVFKRRQLLKTKDIFETSS